MVGLPAEPRRQGQKGLRDMATPASMAPMIGSATVSRAAPGLDCTISPTHLQRVAGKPVSWGGSRASAGVGFDTRYMGTRPRRHPIHKPSPTFKMGRTGNSCKVQDRILGGFRPVIVEPHDIVRDMGEVGPAQIVPQGRTSAS